MTEQPASDVLCIELLPVNEDDAARGSIALLSIQRPDKLNALNEQVSDALKDACAWVGRTDEIRAMILTGAAPNQPAEGGRAKPNAFVAGADIGEFADKRSDDIRNTFAANCWEAVWSLEKPTFAMIDGFALGGGCELAMSCDIRMASSRSRFGQPEIKLGLIPGGGGSQRLTRLVGYGKSMELILGGEMISAEDALACGLVNHVCEPETLLEQTLALARIIASKSAHTLKVAKRAVRLALEQPLSQGVEQEAEMFAQLFDTADKDVGVSAFLNRQEPEWTGS